MTKAILKKEELDLKKNTKKYHWDVDKQKDRYIKNQQKLSELK